MGFAQTRRVLRSSRWPSGGVECGNGLFAAVRECHSRNDRWRSAIYCERASEVFWGRRGKGEWICRGDVEDAGKVISVVVGGSNSATSFGDDVPSYRSPGKLLPSTLSRTLTPRPILDPPYCY